MNVDGTRGARFARWWVGAVTRTAEDAVALDRRAEILSDTHEQLADAWQRDGLATGSRAVVSRVVRGMPADVAWRARLELRPQRFTWHLRNPSTAITALFLVMLPLNVAADSASAGAAALADYRFALWAMTDFVGVCILLFGVLALVSRARPSWMAGTQRFQPSSRLERARRRTTAGLGVALAGSAVLRFGTLEPVGGAFWFGFLACVLLYMALLFATVGARRLTLGRYLPKIGA